ncbi:hypothetical protein [Roseateles violae]|uniref:Uncharacterized protein n=1 Tax=Roseateles violae TaxID=3058042 RepID=A0ABT8DWH1_9BURK|nr:hypothetical protein [Pelomonas sp. PFR6]MDN3922615.1 hypothetical protein [Pelomonas sp. PFR6]
MSSLQLHLTPRLRNLRRRAVYPLLCLLSLLFLPLQPDDHPLHFAAQIAQGLVGSSITLLASGGG